MLRTKRLDIRGFEDVVLGTDAEIDLQAVLAIHSTACGPALGGIRMWPYACREDAVKDATLLAEAMTRKAALAGLALGGGKTVIIGDPHSDKTPALLRGVGELIQTLGGRYFGGEDAGIQVGDLTHIGRGTGFLVGGHEADGGSGDPSATTAQGVALGMQAAVQHRLGSDTLSGLSVAIQGLGKVGWALAEQLHNADVHLVVADLAAERCKQAAEHFEARSVSPDSIARERVDVFAPCAMGGVLDAQSVARLKCAVVAGSANNQCADEQRIPLRLHRKNILHAPDYVINAGGLIRIYVREMLHEDNLAPWLAHIPERLREIFMLSDSGQTPPLWVANQLAERHMADHCQHAEA